MRIGLFGGSFDPPHVGHFLVAGDACDSLGLDRVVFIPAAQQPLKVGRTVAPAETRLEMTRLMTAVDSRFGCDAMEIDRTGLSFSADTAEAYAAAFPEADLYFLIGLDALETLPAWRDPRRLLSNCRLAVLRRSAGTADSSGEEDARLSRAIDRVRELGEPGWPEPVLVPSRRIDVSSTEIRARVREGKPIRGFVTEAVARYLESSGLYR